MGARFASTLEGGGNEPSPIEVFPPLVCRPYPLLGVRIGGVEGGEGRRGPWSAIRYVEWREGKSWFLPALRPPLKRVIPLACVTRQLLRRPPKTGGATEFGGFIARGGPFSRAFFACSTCPLLRGKWSVLARARLPRIFARVYGGPAGRVNPPPPAAHSRPKAGKQRAGKRARPGRPLCGRGDGTEPPRPRAGVAARKRTAGRRRRGTRRQARPFQRGRPRRPRSEAQAGV
jgi:hypothetical protein